MVCMQVFEHVRAPREAIEQLRAVMRPGGHVVWSAPFLEKYHMAPVDMRRYTNDSAFHLLHNQACIHTHTRAGARAHTHTKIHQ